MFIVILLLELVSRRYDRFVVFYMPEWTNLSRLHSTTWECPFFSSRSRHYRRRNTTWTSISNLRFFISVYTFLVERSEIDPRISCRSEGTVI